MTVETIWQSLSFLVIAFLYAAVGHGGATGYLAVLSLTDRPPNEISTTALVLNVMTASLSLCFFARAKQLNFKLCLPLLIASVPAAFAGGMIPLDRGYFLLLAIVLFLTALKLFYDTIRKPTDDSEIKEVKIPAALSIGAVLGLLSGMAGIGGGVFLSPVLLFLRWSTVKQTSAAAALFIVGNSMAGLIVRAVTGRLMFGSLVPFLIAAFIGGTLGAFLGSQKFSNPNLKRALALVLLVAVGKIIMEYLH